jgi:hypothetical protein
MDKEEKKSGGGSGCGCFSTIATLLVLWALIFGVTVGGKHHRITSCSCEKGIEVTP